MKNFKKWIIGSASTLLLSVVGTKINSIAQNIDFSESFKQIFTTIGSFLKSILIFNIPVWIILIGVLILVLWNILFNGDSIPEINFDDASNIPQKHRKTTLEFQDWLLKWDERGNRIVNIRPICTCGCELSPKSDYSGGIRYFLKCAYCGKKYNVFSEGNYRDAENVIVHTLNNLSE